MGVGKRLGVLRGDLVIGNRQAPIEDSGNADLAALVLQSAKVLQEPAGLDALGQRFDGLLRHLLAWVQLVQLKLVQ